MHIILIMAQEPNFARKCWFSFYFFALYFSVFSALFNSLAGRLILNNTVMMSKQYKLYPAAIWNGENKSFIYTVFFKKRLFFPPLQGLYSGKKMVVLICSLTLWFILKDNDLNSLLFNKLASTPTSNPLPFSLWDTDPSPYPDKASG